MDAQNGLIHVYTGSGKGKTTAAVGLSCRAIGHGLKVCFVSFHKNPDVYGYKEMDSMRKLGIDVLNLAPGHTHLDLKLSHESLCEQTLNGFLHAKEQVFSGNYQLVILDEILISIRDGYLNESLLIDLLETKPNTVELVLTGRDALPSITAYADYVSDINCLSHPYEQGITSRKGIEF